jgi:hypothetical protein
MLKHPTAVLQTRPPPLARQTPASPPPGPRRGCDEYKCDAVELNTNYTVYN